MMNGESYNWEATEAYILQGSKLRITFWNVDIGMAIVSADKPFFNHVSLNEAGKLKRSKRIPVCLPSINYNILDKLLLGTGWGADYEQTPSNKYSSCMSSEKGPKNGGFRTVKCLIPELAIRQILRLSIVLINA